MSFKIIQITDTHLFDSNNKLWGDVYPNKTFIQLINEIKNFSLENVIAFFLTGDISEDKSEKSYEIIGEILNKFNKPILWIPGNHDESTISKDTLKNYDNFHSKIKYSHENWDFIFINTKVEGKEFGNVCKADLILIEDEIKKSIQANKFICISMHHHPVEVGTPFMDKVMLQNSTEFLAILKKYNDKIKLVLFGHVHNDYLITQNEIAFEAAYASSIQLTQGCKTLKLDFKSGFKSIEFFNDGAHTSNSYLFDCVKKK